MTRAGFAQPAPAPEAPDAVELIRLPLDFAGDAYAALHALRDRPYPFALMGRWAGGGAVVGAGPRRVLGEHEDPFGTLDELSQLPGSQEGHAVGGGWFGYLGYRLGARVEKLPPHPPRPATLPDFHLAYYDHVLRREPTGGWWLEGLGASGDQDLRRRMAETARCLQAERLPDSPGGQSAAFRVAAPGHEGHRWAVAEAVERIAAGDLFQVNLGLRLEAAWRIHPIDLFTRAAAATEPAHGAVFATPWGGIVSLSPELFLRRRGSSVTTGPIKGTVPRPADGGAGAQRERLLASAKDAAEHVMIVDLMRNDLGRVCEFGSVTRDARRRVEAHPGVWHLVSDVSGTLRNGVGDGELLRATFPPGSVTGAPKVQSMRLISELEGTGRELYTGALGYASPVAGLELAVAIRTFELTRERVWLGAGGGVVADSRPGAELDEALAKAAPLIAAAGAALEAPPPARSARRPRLRATSVADRPDPRFGVFETILVRDGEAVALDRHLERLASSCQELYGLDLPDGVAAKAAARAAEQAGARLRVHACVSGGVLHVECETAALPDATATAELVPVLLPGGLGGHKWRDRRLLDTLARATGASPLIVDSSGEVLEASWANVWVFSAGEHRTPPADGRVLAGIARAVRLEALRREGIPCRVQPLTLDDLAIGDVYLTSSLRGCVPARLRTSAGDLVSG